MNFKYESAVLCIAGNGDVGSKLSVLIDELELPDRIEFEGTVLCTQIPSLLQQAATRRLAEVLAEPFEGGVGR